VDSTTAALVEFSQSLRLEDLSSSTQTAAKVRILDTLACAWGGSTAQPVAITKRALLAGSDSGKSHIVGGGTAPAEAAAFINSLMGRYLDFNDYAIRGQGHPSDMTLPLFAAAEEAEVGGRTVLPAIVTAYSVFFALSLGGKLKDNGWDTAFAMSIGTAAGASKIFGLSSAAMAHAMAIAAACGPPLGVRGSGHLSMWKAGAGPQAAKTGVFAALLAREGMTGPDKPFDGRGGVWAKVMSEFDVRDFLPPNEDLLIQHTGIKVLPVALHTAAPIAAAIELRAEIDDPNMIEAIEIESYLQATLGLGSAERWTPKTRESADHSFPFLVAVALLDGEVTLGSFEPPQLTRSDVGRLMPLVSIKEDKEFSARFPKEVCNRLTIRLSNGTVLQRETGFPLGHPENPADRALLDSKIMTLMAPHMSAAAVHELTQRVLVLEEWESASELFRPADSA
jgi:2-methylcitrate dehydratase